MASARPPSRHGRYHAKSLGRPADVVLPDELPSDSVLEYHGTEELLRHRPDPVIAKMSTSTRRPSDAGSIPERPPTARGHRRPSSRRRHAETYDVTVNAGHNDVSDYSPRDDVRPPRPSSRRRHKRPDSAAMTSDAQGDVTGYSQLTSLEQMAEMTSRPSSSYRQSSSRSRMSPTESPQASSPQRPQSGVRRRNREKSGRPMSRLGQRPGSSLPPRDPDDEPYVPVHHSPRADWSSDSDEGYVPSPRTRQQAALLAPSGAEGYQPDMAPPSAEGQARPKSTKRRVQTSHRRHPQDGTSEGDEELPAMPVLRPPSSFSKYKLLPAIGGPSPVPNSGPSADDLDLPVNMADMHVNDSMASPGGHNDLGAVQYQMVTPGSILDEVERQQRQNSAGSSNSSYRPSATARSVSSMSSGSQVIEVDRERFRPLDSPHDLPSEPRENEARILLAVKLPTNGRRHQRHFRPDDTLQTVLNFAENVSSVDLSDFRLARNAPKRLFTSLESTIRECGLEDRTALYLEEKDDD